MRSTGLVCLLLALGCGDIQTTGSGDGGPGSGDAGSPDARAVGSITVRLGRLFGQSQPLADNQVVVVDPEGAVAAETTTDADGLATTGDIEAGSTLIILIAQPPTGAPVGTQALVIAGVEPGDDIRLDPEPDQGDEVGTMNVSWPPLGVGGETYFVDTGCGGTSTSDTVTTLSFSEGCLIDGEAQVLIRADDGASTTLGWLGGSVPFSNGDPFDVVGTWREPRDLSVTLTDIPPEALAVFPSLQPTRGGLQLNRINLSELQLDQDTIEIHLAAPRSFVDSSLVALGFQPNQPSFGSNQLGVRVAPDETEVELSLADELVPWYSVPVLDSPSRTIQWSHSSGLDPDAQFLIMFWTDKDTSSGGTFVMMPPGVTAVTLPELPSEYPQYIPGNPITVAMRVEAGESTDIDGYRAARQTGFSLVYEDPQHGLEPPSTLRRASAGVDN